MISLEVYPMMIQLKDNIKSPSLELELSVFNQDMETIISSKKLRISILCFQKKDIWCQPSTLQVFKAPGASKIKISVDKIRPSYGVVLNEDIFINLKVKASDRKHSFVVISKLFAFCLGLAALLFHLASLNTQSGESTSRDIYCLSIEKQWVRRFNIVFLINTFPFEILYFLNYDFVHGLSTIIENGFSMFIFLYCVKATKLMAEEASTNYHTPIYLNIVSYSFFFVKNIFLLQAYGVLKSIEQISHRTGEVKSGVFIDILAYITAAVFVKNRNLL